MYISIFKWRGKSEIIFGLQWIFHFKNPCLLLPLVLAASSSLRKVLLIFIFYSNS